jgi:hypothetical protein
MKRQGLSAKAAAAEEAENVARPWAEEGEEEGKGDGTGSKSRRLRKPRALKRAEAVAKAAAAAAASSALEVGPSDNNQGVPGSVEGGRPMNETEAGQRQQEEADAFWQEPRVVDLVARHNRENDELRTSHNKLLVDLCDAQTTIAKNLGDHRAEILRRQNASREEAALSRDSSDRLDLALEALEKANAAAKADKLRIQVQQDLIEKLRKDTTSLSSELTELTDTLHTKHQLEAEKDEAEILTNGLQERIDALESELALKETLATENTDLQDQIAEVHSSFEDAFSDMAKGLTIDEKFAYVHEHQKPVLTGRPRIVSTASLHEELDDLSDAGSEHASAKLKEILSISGITSVETAPVAAAVTQKQPTISFGFSKLISIDTAPIAAPVAAPVITKRKPTVSFGLSNITSVESTPIPAPVAAPAEKPAPEIRVQWRTPRTVYKHVDRAVVPWWMWFLFLIAIVTCASGFAGLLREKQIWLDANDLAYQRLMGAEQETWLRAVSLGVQDLLPGMGLGEMGYSLFG